LPAVLPASCGRSGMRSCLVRQRGGTAAPAAGQTPVTEGDYPPGTSASAFSADRRICANDGRSDRGCCGAQVVRIGVGDSDLLVGPRMCRLRCGRVARHWLGLVVTNLAGHLFGELAMNPALQGGAALDADDGRIPDLWPGVETAVVQHPDAPRW
jgi:hypothetical protein